MIAQFDRAQRSILFGRALAAPAPAWKQRRRLTGGVAIHGGDLYASMH
jgi:hypothetical protein